MIILIGLSASASLLPGPGSAGRCLIKCWYRDHIWWSRSYLKTSRWTQTCIQSIIYQKIYKCLVSLSHSTRAIQLKQYPSPEPDLNINPWITAATNRQSRFKCKCKFRVQCETLKNSPASTSIVRCIPNIKIEPFAALCPSHHLLAEEIEAEDAKQFCLSPGMAIYSKCNLIVVVSFETQFHIFLSAPCFLSQFNNFYVKD